VKWCIKPHFISIAYLLSNDCTKNYWNQTTIVEIIVGGWVVSFFETQCSSFNNMQVLIFCELGLITPIHAPIIGVFGGKIEEGVVPY